MYQHPRLTVAALAAELSAPEQARRLNGLSIPAPQVVGIADAIHR